MTQALALATIEAVQHQLYTLLSLRNASLLLPQSEVRTLESVLDLSLAKAPAHGVGWLPFAGNTWPVYCLDDDLNPLPQPLPMYRLCALLTLPEGYLGLLCMNVTTVQRSAVHLQALPPVMTKPHTPLRGLARQDNRAIPVSTAIALAAYFGLNAPNNPYDSSE